MSSLPSPPSLASGSAPIASAIHLEFIRSVIDAGEPDGAECVESFHRSLFLQQHGPDLERFRSDRKSVEERLSALEPRLQQVHRTLAAQERFVATLADGVPDDQPNAPWNLWDRFMFGSAGLGVLALLVFGVFNISFNLLESGIVTFSSHPIRAYFWAALLPVGALAVKVGWDFLRSRPLRDLYLWLCLGLGIVSVFAWVLAYASVYPSLSRTTDEQIAALSVFANAAPASDAFWGNTASGVKRIDMILVATQAAAEICLSAALGIYMTQIYQRHRPVRLAENPSFQPWEQDRRTLEEEIARERTALAVAIGNENRIEQQLHIFVAYARSLFQRESTARHDVTQQKRRLIDEMAGQLRSRLEAIDRLGEPAESNGKPSLPT